MNYHLAHPLSRRAGEPIPPELRDALIEETERGRPISLGYGLLYCGDHTPGAEHPCLLPIDRKRGCPLHGPPDSSPLFGSPKSTPNPPWRELVTATANTFELAALPFRQVELERRWHEWLEDWQRLELLTSRWLQQDHCTNIQGQGKPGDGGVDVVAQTPSGRIVAVQCKRYEDVVPASELKVFHYDTTLGWEHTSAWHSHHPPRPEHRIFLTTNWFTDPARRVAQQAGIHLVDGPALAVWCGFGFPLRNLLKIDHW
ncbi:restriction endonuclease [Streptomyces antnestii]|uniref:Restriction endonuclease n=1 Tax=Streptomyces antnestii TaxID=2494256 RepID=A0A437Q3L7_9ACTN|nr:restriction endonuclease [Streptomyces sp. San01]RVU29071.1 restriction endonuclease [Streptomyces sp. San01]